MLDKAYDAKKYEDAIYKKWEDSGAFKADNKSKKKPFTISMPPPNATGTLHLGHAIMLALEDILIRHRRMKGYEVLWVPGTDHAAIATQNKVEKLIAEEGLTRDQLGREGFLQRVREFVAESQNIIRNQIRKMGSSCDWSRERYTLDDDLNTAVNEIFIRMFKDGLIYRGHRIVNWCTRCSSTLADDEVEYMEIQSKFYYIKYGPVTIGTARPETKFADKVVVVNPDDKRYKKYVGKTMEIDWIDGKINATFIADKEADMEMGSGAMTITPAHSFVDFDLAKKYKLEVLPIIDEAGKMLPIAGEFAGMDYLECRDKLVKKMQKLGLIESIDENYTHNLSVCYRCNTAVQPLVSEQWFIDVNKKLDAFGGKSIKQKSIDVVKKGDIEIIPDRFNKTYFHWMEDLRDWCISRQLWWGHRIPVWYCVGDQHCQPDCKKPIVESKSPEKCPACGSKNLRQDEDTLDTWFSSGLWTFSTLGWPKKTDDFNKFHPTSVLETGYDILFFWVARMIIMTTYATGEIPFEKVYLHGLIRDKEGRKMSKSLGNGIDPIEMIEKFGTDALRMSMVIGNTPGNDMRLYEEKIMAYRNFTNKLWNASRFVLGIFEENGLKQAPAPDSNLSDADQWILDKLNKTIKSADDALMNFRISEAGQILYDFLWNDFCDWYLELSKGEKQNLLVLYEVLKNVLILLHPIVPFVTEQIWSEMPGTKGMLIQAEYPKGFKGKFDGSGTELTIAIVSSIRRLRGENKIEPGAKVPVTIYGGDEVKRNQDDIIRLARISELTLKKKGDKLKGAAADMVEGIEIYIPLDGLVDTKKEKERLSKEIENLEQYIASISGKLLNKNFVQNAPKEIVDAEKMKMEEAKNKVKKMKEQMGNL